MGGYHDSTHKDEVFDDRYRSKTNNYFANQYTNLQIGYIGSQDSVFITRPPKPSVYE